MLRNQEEKPNFQTGIQILGRSAPRGILSLIKEINTIKQSTKKYNNNKEG